ncbi:MAG: hypothetical protein MUD01_06825 [Chloroflexaceae bacterium]|nr:hypothetical protein [Chloroflexaceae bacterium]
MSDDFGAQLDAFIRQAGLPVRRVASYAGIPHQTLFNWLNGTRPRWHPALTDDLHRLGLALGLASEEIDLLLQRAGCLPQRETEPQMKENPMSEKLVLPKGWFAAGSHPKTYHMGLDPAVRYEQSVAACIKATESPEGFGTLMQMFKADAYRGQRLRFAAAVRAASVEQWAGLWMRVDGPNNQMLAFDNMRSRKISGSCDWTCHAVVLDVADSAINIAFGILLQGAGQVWLAGVRVEPVGTDVPVTEATCPVAPTNLDFSEQETEKAA